jgi:hypothetical protein
LTYLTAVLGSLSYCYTLTFLTSFGGVISASYLSSFYFKGASFCFSGLGLLLLSYLTGILDSLSYCYTLTFLASF